MKFILIIKGRFDVDPPTRYHGPIEAASEEEAWRVVNDSPVEVGEDEECDLSEITPLPL